METIVALAGDIDDESTLPQPFGQEGSGLRLVFDDQNPHARLAPFSPDRGMSRRHVLPKPHHAGQEWAHRPGEPVPGRLR